MTNSYPPYGPPGSFPPPGWQPEPPPKKRSWPRRHKVLTALGALAVIIVASGIAGAVGGGGGTNPGPGPYVTPPGTAFTPSPVVATPDAPQPDVTGVEFVVTGNVPASDFGEVSITWGSDSDSHDVTLSSLNGRRVFHMAFNGAAQYYDIDATFTSSGHLTCKIIPTGPDVQPQAVSKGSATGDSSGGDCSAQAAPENTQGTQWQNEQ